MAKLKDYIIDLSEHKQSVLFGSIGEQLQWFDEQNKIQKEKEKALQELERKQQDKDDWAYDAWIDNKPLPI